MKVTSAIVLFCCLGLALAQFPTCTERQCVKAEEVCGWISNLTFTNCRSDSYCTYSNTGSFDEDGTGICRVPLRIGESCSGSGIDGVCESGTSCLGNVCAAKSPFGSGSGFLYPGESCDYNMECIYNSPYVGSAGTKDSENLCNGKCKSIKRGDYCTANNGQCNYNKDYCGRKNLCEKYIKDGDACFFNDVTSSGCGKVDRTCVPNGLNGNAGTCRKRHSQGKTQYCKSIDDCKEGLYCNRFDGNSYGVCLEPYKTETLNKPCPSANVTIFNGCNTTNFETCACTTKGESKCIVASLRPKGYHGAFYDLEECTRKHNCDTSDVEEGFACIKEHCKGKTCKMYKTLQKHESGFGSTSFAMFANSCAFEGLCNSAFTLVASPILALLAFIVVFAL